MYEWLQPLKNKDDSCYMDVVLNARREASKPRWKIFQPVFPLTMYAELLLIKLHATYSLQSETSPTI